MFLVKIAVHSGHDFDRLEVDGLIAGDIVDTHALIWFSEGNPALIANARAVMGDDADERFISHATTWRSSRDLSEGLFRFGGQIGWQGSRAASHCRSNFPLELPRCCDWIEPVPLVRVRTLSQGRPRFMKSSHLPQWTSTLVVLVSFFRLSAAIGASPASTQGGSEAALLSGDPVKVTVFENLPAGKELELTEAPPTEEYTERAFGFVRFPTKYSSNALALDRSTPFVIRASLHQALPAGEYHFRLRSKGAARFLIDGQALLTTKAQKPNASGNDPVPPPAERNNSTWRPVQYPHQEELAAIQLDGEKHHFTLIALMGSKGLVPLPGELSLSFGREGEVPQLLGSADPVLLTDEAWESYAAEQSARHNAADMARRRAISADTTARWQEYNHQVRDWVKKRPAPEAPKVKSQELVFNAIDQFVLARLEEAQVVPTPLTSDLEFFRRLSLDTVGTIPAVEDVSAFLNDPPSQRRRQAIDRFLNHSGWADHWVSYWQDVLAENPGILKPDLNNSGPFRWWLHQSFTDNIPFNRLVAELIQMEGSIFQGAPAAFKLATLNDSPMAAKADILSQAFLGEKLSCARCHDAPDHPRKQRDTFSFAAMLDGKPVKIPVSSTVPFVEGFRKPRVEVTLKPGEEISPHWPYAELVDASDMAAIVPVSSTAPATRRQVAAMMVTPENERFAKVLVNRLWKRYLGAGLVEPAEDWYLAKPSHPELLEYLAREFVVNGYDLKAIVRLILTSRVYQQKPLPAAAAIAEPKERLFAGPIRRHLSAEQLVDSLYRAAGKTFSCEELNLNPAGNRPLNEFLNLGNPRRAWQFTALMNERDRPALALPIAQSIVDVLTTYGWRQSRQNPMTVRQDAPSPMQTILLANGIVGTRITRLSDDSAFTELALEDRPLQDLVNETFLRLLTRPPSQSESRVAQDYLMLDYPDRKQQGAAKQKSAVAPDKRVSWANHLSAEATLIRMEEERRLRMGDIPTSRLSSQFRESYEDLLWSLVNSPEFTLIP